MTNSPTKYDFIDVVRAFAILGVILLHTSDWVQPSSKILGLISTNGAQGVQLFFIASALTLFLSLRSRRQDESSPNRNFFIRRFFRIAPMYYLALVFYLLLDGFGKQLWAPFGEKWWWPLLSVFFVNGWHPETINSMVPGGWSIAVEMTFYLLVPFLFLRLKSIRSTLFFIILTLALGWALNLAARSIFSPLYPPKYLYMIDGFTFFWFFAQLPIFGIGILAYQIFDRYKHIQDRKLGAVLLTAALFLVAAFLDTSTYADLIPHHFLLSIGFAFFVLGLYFAHPRILINPLMVWIGKVSFSVYLIHFAVLMALQAIFPKGILLSGNLGLAIAYLVVVVISVLYASLTYRFVEQPGIQLGKTIINRLESAHAARHTIAESGD